MYTAREVVESGEKHQTEQPGNREDRRPTALEVDGTSVGVVHNGRLRNAKQVQVAHRKGRENQRDDDGRAHAEHADRQTAEHAGHDERKALDRAYKPVRVGVFRFGHQQRHRCREREARSDSTTHPASTIRMNTQNHVPLKSSATPAGRAK